MTGGQFVSNCTADAISAAAKALQAGSLVAFPTETVYGLGADANNDFAVSRIYKVKGRPNDHPLIVHVASLDRIHPWIADIPEYAIALARSFWPGPMTLILKRSDLAKNFVTGGQDTVGLRVPSHPIALALLEAAHDLDIAGIAAPSANRFGHVSPTNSQAVRDELENFLDADDLILDGGQSDVGVESTIIDCTGDLPRVLRPGAITEEMIKNSIGQEVSDEVSGIRVSGSLENHYAPEAKVLLDVEPQPGDGLIALSEYETPIGVLRLGKPSNNEEFARILYQALRSGDYQKLSRIVVIQPKGEDIAIAIRDRLLRASRGR